MKFDVLQALIIFDRIFCSSYVEEGCGIVDLKASERSILFPIIFCGTNAIVLPITRFRDLKKGTKEESYAKEFIRHISHVILSFTTYDIYCEDNSQLEAIFKREMGKHMEKVSKDALSVFIKGKNTFSELLMMAYDRLFQSDEKYEKNRRMTVFGKCLIEEADKMMNEIADDMDAEERRKREDFCNMIKERGEKCCDITRWKRVALAESIVCDASVSLYNNLPSEQLLGLLAEGYMRKDFKERGFSEEELKKRGYMEYNIVDIKLFLDTYVKHGSEVIEEIVRQMMMGKDGREIDSEYVEKIVQVVDERRRREEREASEHADKLLGEEFSGKKSVRKAKAKKGKRSKKSLGGVEEEAEASESRDEELAGAVGGLCVEGRKPKSINHYRIHKRVLLWMKDVSSIKRALDGGREEKWKGKSIEDITKQKITHDIIEVVRLLRSEDRDRFFMPGESWVEDDVPRHRKVAVGVLEIEGERMVGIVEASSYKDKDGSDVIYHLMFRRTNVKEIGGVVSQGEDFSTKMESTSCGEFSESEDGSGFLYGKGIRCEVWHNFDKFVVTWGNRRNTREVLKRLTVLCRPKAI
ncbi:DUF1609 domain-containing protein [Encephalitozoon hellem]|nr:DUF1609 domain-containing protein [Encephalitozoon hellem]